MVEQLKGSKPWRDQVVAAAVDYMDADDPWFPISKPQAVAVDIVLHFHRPKSTPLASAPTTRSTGDIDKHSRNILDALTDAGVFEDDSQVTDLFARKRYVPSDVEEGALIQVRYAA